MSNDHLALVPFPPPLPEVLEPLVTGCSSLPDLFITLSLADVLVAEATEATFLLFPLGGPTFIGGLITLMGLSTQYEREPLYFHISNVSHWHGLIATHCTDAVPPAAYASLRDCSLTLRVQVTLFAQYHFNAGQLFRNLGHFQQFRRHLIKPATIHTQRRSQNLVKPAPPL